MMNWTYLLRRLMVVGLLTVAVSACNSVLPEALDTTSQGEPAGLTIQEITASVQEWDLCSTDNVSIRARIRPGPQGFDYASLEYRISGNASGAAGAARSQRMVQISTSEEQFVTEALISASALDDEIPPGSQIEFWVIAFDQSGAQHRYPDPSQAPDIVALAPCQDDGSVEAGQTEAPYTVVDYGASPAEVQYGPGCSPESVAFEIILHGSGSVESVWVNTTWMGPDGLSGETKRPMEDLGYTVEPAGARRYGVEIEIEGEADANLHGEYGQLAWNIYVEKTDGAVLEYPVGGPPVVAVEYCGVASATSTPGGPIIVLPIVTPTPTQGFIIVPGLLVHSQGSQEALRELNFFDLDAGTLFQGTNGQVDFQLHPGDDVYLDDIRPFNGSYFGWYGQDQPNKADCQNTLKANASMTINWPEMKDTFFCFETSDGRTGWLRIDTYVSLPLPERRLAFSWTTYK